MTTVSPESVGLGRSQKGWTSIFETGVSSRSCKRCGWGDGGLVTEVKKIVSSPGMALANGFLEIFSGRRLPLEGDRKEMSEADDPSTPCSGCLLRILTCEFSDSLVDLKC